VFNRGTELVGKSVPVVSESISMPDVLAIIGDVTGRKIAYHFAPDDAIRSLPFSWAKEVANVYQYFREGNYQVLLACGECEQYVAQTGERKVSSGAEGRIVVLHVPLCEISKGKWKKEVDAGSAGNVWSKQETAE